MDTVKRSVALYFVPFSGGFLFAGHVTAQTIAPAVNLLKPSQL
jgi:hypothetical protein